MNKNEKKIDKLDKSVSRRTFLKTAAAGAAVIFNNSSYHAGTVRQTPHRRRTVHVRYRQPEPVSSRHALKEPWQSVAEFTAALPDRPTIGTLE